MRHLLSGVNVVLCMDTIAPPLIGFLSTKATSLYQTRFHPSYKTTFCIQCFLKLLLYFLSYNVQSMLLDFQIFLTSSIDLNMFLGVKSFIFYFRKCEFLKLLLMCKFIILFILTKFLQNLLLD